MGYGLGRVHRTSRLDGGDARTRNAPQHRPESKHDPLLLTRNHRHARKSPVFDPVFCQGELSPHGVSACLAFSCLQHLE